MCGTLDPYDILPSEISAMSTVHPSRLTPGTLEGPSASDLNPVQVLDAIRASVLLWDAKRLPINQNATAHHPTRRGCPDVCLSCFRPTMLLPSAGWLVLVRTTCRRAQICRERTHREA